MILEYIIYLGRLRHESLLALPQKSVFVRLLDRSLTNFVDLDITMFRKLCSTFSNKFYILLQFQNTHFFPGFSAKFSLIFNFLAGKHFLRNTASIYFYLVVLQLKLVKQTALDVQNVFLLINFG